MTKTGRKGDYLTGSVVLEGGSLLWDPIPVTVTCDGQVRYTTAADPKGYFAIAPVEPLGSTIMADPKPVAARFLGCAVEAVLPGFNATPLPIANRNISDTSRTSAATQHD